MSNSFQEKINSSTPTLVDFYADWCQPCHMQAPILKDLKKDMGDKLNIIKVDVDKNQPLAQKLRVQGIPTLILYKEGKIVWRESGVRSKADLKSIVQQYS